MRSSRLRRGGACSHLDAPQPPSTGYRGWIATSTLQGLDGELVWLAQNDTACGGP